MWNKLTANELIDWFSQQRVSVDLTDVDVDLLREYTKDAKRYVEIGTKYGGSALVVASGINHPIVDTYDILDYTDSEYFIGQEEFIKNNELRSIINFHIEKSPEAAKNYVGTIDTLFIDGAHDYQSVLEDYAGWLPNIITNSVIIFHDYAPHSPGVIKVCDTFIVGNPRFEVLRKPTLEKRDASSMFIARKI